MTVTRTPLHTRTIQIDGFARSDGLFDVDARLTDQKHYRMANWPGGALETGDLMHDMVVTMTVDAEGVIREMKARADAHPHEICQTGATNFQRLVGLSIRKGFLKAVGERLQQNETCTHIREMLQQMATVAFQSMREARQKTYGGPAPARPVLADTCMAWRSDGDWVRVRFPAHYTGKESPPEVDRHTFESRLHAEGFDDVETKKVKANVRNEDHAHDFDVLGLVFAGEMTLTIDGQSRTYRPGQVVDVPAGTVHREQYGPQGYTVLLGKRHTARQNAA